MIVRFAGGQRLDFPAMSVDEFVALYEKATTTKLIEIENPKNGRRVLINPDQITMIVNRDE